LDRFGRSTTRSDGWSEAYQPERIYLFGSICARGWSPRQRLRPPDHLSKRCVTRASSEPPCLRGPEGNGGAGGCARSVRTIGSSQSPSARPRCRGPCSARKLLHAGMILRAPPNEGVVWRRAATDLRQRRVDPAADPPGAWMTSYFNCQHSVEKAMRVCWRGHDCHSEDSNLDALRERPVLRLDPSLKTSGGTCCAADRIPLWKFR